MAEEQTPLSMLSTSQNKTSANIVAGFVITAGVWYLNEKLKAGIPEWIAAGAVTALNALLTWIVPNRRVAPAAASDDAFDARVTAAVQAALAKRAA